MNLDHMTLSGYTGDHCVCKAVSCFADVHKSVSTSLFNLFMVSRNAEEGLRWTEDLSESSFIPLSFSHCVSVLVIPLNIHHELLAIGWSGIMTQSVKFTYSLMKFQLKNRFRLIVFLFLDPVMSCLWYLLTSPEDTCWIKLTSLVLHL